MHMLSYVAGRLAREAAKATVHVCGGSKSDADLAGLACQATVGVMVGIVTFDIGAHAFTLGDVALGGNDTSFHSNPYASGAFFTESTGAPDYVPPEDRSSYM